MPKHSLHRLIPVLALLACAALPQSAAASSKILVMGDSLSAAYGMATGEGWVSLLTSRLKNRGYGLRVVNASVSGETTSGGLARLPHTLDEHRPELVIIELGANDGLRGIDPDHTRRSLMRMVELSQRLGADVLLAGMRLPTNYGEAFRQRYYNVYTSVSESARVPLVPFLLAGVAQNPRLMQEDGLHPTAEAQAVILDNVWRKLEPLIADFRVR